ncbi:hypothetical protein Tco_0300838 [Tanacetum coccineum]
MNYHPKTYLSRRPSSLPLLPLRNGNWWTPTLSPYPKFKCSIPLHPHGLLRTIRCAFKNRPSGPPSGKKKKGGGGRGRTRVKVSKWVMMRWKQVKSLHVLERLHLVLGLVHLDRFLIVCLKAIVHTVTDIPVMALDSCGNSWNYNKLCSLCSEILSELLKYKHGDKIINYCSRDVKLLRSRAELRALAVESILEIVKALEHKDQIDFVDYVVNMTRGREAPT